jgi:hypothetical protein
VAGRHHAQLGGKNNGETMDNRYQPQETDDLWSISSYQEMEYRLKSLRSLVCDLLKTNQELRHALFAARIDPPGGDTVSKD